MYTYALSVFSEKEARFWNGWLVEILVRIESITVEDQSAVQDPFNMNL